MFITQPKATVSQQSKLQQAHKQWHQLSYGRSYPRPKNSLFAPSLLQGMEKSSIFSNLKKGKFLLIFPHVHFAIHYLFEKDGGTRIAGAQILRLVSHWSLAMIMQGKCFPAVWCVSISDGNPAKCLTVSWVNWWWWSQRGLCLRCYLGIDTGWVVHCTLLCQPVQCQPVQTFVVHC